MSAAIINSVGLFLDIIGVILLFIFGLPSRFVSDGPPTNTISFGWDPDSVKQSGEAVERGISSCRGSPWSFWFLVSPFRLPVTTWVYWAGRGESTSESGWS